MDASAILAAILGEAGGDVVFERMDEALISTVNVAEVYTYAAVKGIDMFALDAFFIETGIEIVPFDQAQAVAAGRLAGITRKAGLSLGDRSCLALAQHRDAEVMTADRAWQRIADEAGLRVSLLR